MQVCKDGYNWEKFGGMNMKRIDCINFEFYIYFFFIYNYVIINILKVLQF